MAQPLIQPTTGQLRPTWPQTLLTWAALSATLLIAPLPLLFLKLEPNLLLREYFARDPSSNLLVTFDDRAHSIVLITSQERWSPAVVWEERTVLWLGARPPANEVDSAMAAHGSTTSDRELAALPTGTTTAPRPGLGLIYLPLLALALTEPLFWLRSRWRSRRAALQASRNRCTTCGYSRTGLSPNAPCPECGTQGSRPTHDS